MKIWPLLVLAGSVLALACAAEILSGGLPWGIDDGVKRLMARHWIQSGGRTVILSPDNHLPEGERFFSIPPPFAEPADSGFRAIFPALFPALSGFLQSGFGHAGIYLLPCGGFVLLLFFFSKSLRGLTGPADRWWAGIVLGSSLLFYALTFWEHTIALLCLLPLVNGLARQQHVGRSSWLWNGAALGIAISLRIETALLFPPLLVALSIVDPLHPQMWNSFRSRLFPLLLGCMTGLLLASAFEYFAAGRLIPSQTKANLALAFQGRNLLGYLEQILAMLLNSPMETSFYGLLLVVALAMTILAKAPLFFACLLPLLSLGLLIWGWLEHHAFGLVSQSQGLFFAAPWLAILLMAKPSQKYRPDVLTVLGGGYLILLYLLGPNQPGMHWGPRFLFPALLPLLWRSVILLAAMPSLAWRRTVMILTAAAAILNASASIAALAQRGSTGAHVISRIREQRLDWLAVNRWHVGADLEPLWVEIGIAWTPEVGSLEEFLIGRAQMGDSLRLGCLWQDGDLDADQLPLRIERQSRLPRQAGWGGELWTGALANSSDPRWGNLYWHAARRRAEANDFSAALPYLEKASSLAPHNPDILYDRAICLGKMNKMDEAMLTLERVLALDPQHEEGLILWRRLVAARQDFPEAFK